MKNKITKGFYAIMLPAFALLLSSCYKQFADVPFPAQSIYMPSATGGFYLINDVAVPGQTFRYTVDQAAGKLIIPLAAYRSGLTNGGNIDVTVTAHADTVNKLIAAGTLTATDALPADKYTVPPTTVIPGGDVLGKFALSVDLNLLLANPAKKYAVAVGINSTQVKPTAKNVTIIVISASFLVPAASFTYSADAATPKKYNFANTSAFSVAWSWDFGDGTPAVTDKSPSHTYAASGTYVVTLTSTGAAGPVNPSVQTATMVVP